jgi:hypothetical protein
MITDISKKTLTSADEPIFIEPKINTIVDVLDSTGLIHITACCEGHRFPAQAPLIYFRASEAVAREVDMGLRAIWMNKDNRLNYFWAVSSRFDENYETYYRLHSPLLDSCCYNKSLFASMQWMYSICSRKDDDLLTLGRCLPSLLEKSYQ